MRKGSQRAVCKVTLPDYCYWLWTWRVGWSLGQTTVQREGVNVPALTISQVISNRLKYEIGLSKTPSCKLMVHITLLLLLLLLYLLSSMYTVSSVMYLKRTMYIVYTMLQLFCGYNSWHMCSYAMTDVLHFTSSLSAVGVCSA